MSDQCNDSHLGEYLRKGSCVENDQPDIINATLSVFGNAYIRAATSENTRKAYRSDIRHYENNNACPKYYLFCSIELECRFIPKEMS